ncbi:MAG: PAS domain S-box protein [Rubrivivax sp.]
MAAPSAVQYAPLTEALAASARRTFFRVAAAMSLAGAPLALLLPPRRADPWWFVAAFAALGVAAALALRLPAQRQPPALTAFLAADSVALAAVALAWPGSFGEAAMALFGVLACVSFAGSGRRSGLAVAALQVLLLLAVHATLWPADASAQGMQGAQGAHLARLALHLLNVAAGTAAGLLIARALVLPMRLAAEREAALLATQSLYRDLFTLSPVALVVHRAGVAIDANPAALALYGAASLDELRRLNLYDFFEDGEHRQRAYARRDAIRELPIGSVLPMADFRLEVGARAVGAHLGRAHRGRRRAGGAGDHRRRHRAPGRRSGGAPLEAMLSHVVATTPDLVTVTEVASGRFIMVNPAFERDLGWTAAEAIGRSSAQLRTWWSGEERPAFIAALQESGRIYNRPAAFRTRAGGRLEVSVSAARFALAGGEYIVLSARDLTAIERLRLEREAILTNASVGIAVTRQRRFVLANRHFEQMFGWGEGELLGHEGRVVWPDQAAYRGVGRHHGAALARGERVEFEAVMARRDGGTLLAQVRARHRPATAAGRRHGGSSRTSPRAAKPNSRCTRRAAPPRPPAAPRAPSSPTPATSCARR